MAETPRVRLGELLVRSGLITQQQLEEALALQASDGRRLGTLLVELGLVSETQVTQILSQQLSVPWVSLLHIDFSRQLLNLVPEELVHRYTLIPIYVRRVRGLGDALYVAMDDPTDTQALEEVAQYSGLHVRAMIAPPSDIRTAIQTHYGAGEEPVRARKEKDEEDEVTGIHQRTSSNPEASPAPIGLEGEKPDSRVPAKSTVTVSSRPLPMPSQTASRNGVDRQSSPTSARPEPLPLSYPPISRPSTASQPPGSRPPAPSQAPVSRPPAASQAPVSRPPAASQPPVSRPPAASQPPASRPPPRSQPPASQPPRSPASSPPMRGADAPTPAKGAGRALSLTLLDGTTINFPAQVSGTQPPPGGKEDQLTARDLVAALRAAAHGADASEILGDSPKWEAMLAALLAILLRKHLISDWEFIEEYKKG